MVNCGKITSCITFCICQATSELNNIFHLYAHPEAFLDFILSFTSPADNDILQTVRNQEKSSVNNLASDSKLSVRSFRYIKK